MPRSGPESKGREKVKRLIVRWREGHCNLPITHIEREGALVEAYRGIEFVGVFDIGSVDALYISEREQDAPPQR